MVLFYDEFQEPVIDFKQVKQYKIGSICDPFGITLIGKTCLSNFGVYRSKFWRTSFTMSMIGYGMD